MSAPNDGGPAFPHPGFHGIDGKFVDVPHQGMTLRDWFAGMALQGFAAHPGNNDWTRQEVARDSYGWADAMLAERGAQ
jgi:hypothetical protein